MMDLQAVASTPTERSTSKGTALLTRKDFQQANAFQVISILNIMICLLGNPCILYIFQLYDVHDIRRSQLKAFE